MKKFTVFIICIAMLMPLVNLFVLALPQEIGSYYCEALQFPESEIIIPDKSNIPNEFWSNPNGTYKFYDYLTEPQKAVYDCVVENEAGINTDGEFELVFPKTSEENALTVQAALSAIIDDYPEYFWVGGFGWTSGYAIAGIYHLSFYLTFKTSDYDDWDAIKNAYDSLILAVNSVEISGNTRYGKLKSIHDYICSITTYKTGVPMAHQPTGVFLNGQAVCEGYAEAFKLLCDRENIPCILVIGTGNGGAHEWNYVQMEDGLWYGMDVTWDDGITAKYDYFLIGANSVTSCYSGNSKFGNGTETSGDHINIGSHYQSNLYILSYPTIATESYTGIALYSDADATFDNQKGFMYIPKNVLADHQFWCTISSYANFGPPTNQATVSGATTGGTVNIASPVTKTYTIVRIGDVNKDNSVNITDYNTVRQIATCQQSSYSKNSAQFAAADMNGDGIIDALDAIELDIYYNN